MLTKSLNNMKDRKQANTFLDVVFFNGHSQGRTSYTWTQNLPQVQWLKVLKCTLIYLHTKSQELLTFPRTDDPRLVTPEGPAFGTEYDPEAFDALLVSKRNSTSNLGVLRVLDGATDLLWRSSKSTMKSSREKPMGVA